MIANRSNQKETVDRFFSEVVLAGNCAASVADGCQHVSG
jgi:hypothetical protein